MERRLISGHSPFEAVAGFSRAVVVGSTVHVAGTAPIPADGSPAPESAYEQARLCLAIIAEALERAGSSVDDVVRTRMFVTDRAHWPDVSRAHGEVFGETRPAATCVVTSLLDPSWKVEIEAEAVIGSSKQLIPADITGKGGSGTPGSRASVLDHKFGQSDPYTLGVEEEYQLLDGTSFDLVQHIDTVLAAIAGHELEPQINTELMQSVLEIATPVCHTPADVMRELVKLRGYVCGVARAKGLRVGSAGTHPFSLFERQRITAKDRYRQLVDQLQYIARRELIFGMHIHVAIDGPEKAIKVMSGLLPQLAPLLALSASSPFWRGEPTGPDVEPADGVLVLPALGPAAALPRLRGLRRGRRAARAHRLHRRLHAHLVGHPPPPAARHARDPDLRRGHARSRTPSRSPRTARRS